VDWVPGAECWARQGHIWGQVPQAAFGHRWRNREAGAARHRQYWGARIEAASDAAPYFTNGTDTDHQAASKLTLYRAEFATTDERGRYASVGGIAPDRRRLSPTISRPDKANWTILANWPIETIPNSLRPCAVASMYRPVGSKIGHGGLLCP